MVKSMLLVWFALAASAAAAAEQPAGEVYPREQPANVQPATEYSPVFRASQNLVLLNGTDALDSGGVLLSGYCDSDLECDESALPACSTCNTGGCGATCPRYYVQADAVFFESDNETRDQAVVINTNTSASLIRTIDPAFDPEVGVRLLAGYRLNCATAVEVSYFGPFEWDDSRTVVGNNDLGIPGALGLASLDFFGADVVHVDYSSKLENFEINVARCLCCCDAIQFLAGFRYLTLDESFNINSTDFDTGTSDYNVQTQNTLYGGQIGLRVQHGLPWLRLEASGKAGIFANESNQIQFVSDFPPPFLLRPQQSSSTNGTAFVGELSFVFTVPLTDCWGLRAGYNLLWIDDVALAADQLDFSNTPTSGSLIDDNGRAFIHGAIVGVERRW